MKLSEILTPERIRIPLSSETKEGVLQELVSLLPSARNEESRDRVLQAILEREARMSTGIGQGVAIPHGKCDLVRGMEVTFGISGKPLDFDALDGDPVAIFFLLVSPPDLTGPHIRALARISRMLLSGAIRDELVRVRTPGEALALFRREEALLEE